MKMHTHLLVFLLSSALLLHADDTRRVVALGDVHGDFDRAVAILQEIGLIDDQLKWRGGDSILVQTGDLLDRGPQIIEVMDLFMRLEKEAPQQGGEVIVLLGNHEIMNMTGFLKDVNPDVYADFTDEDSEKRRNTAYRGLVNHNRKKARNFGLRWTVRPGFKENWYNKYGLGHIEYMEAFGPEGKYGKWLREKDAIAKVDGRIYMHAGIPPKMASMSIEDINKKVRQDIQESDKWHRFLLDNDITVPHYTANAKMGAVINFLEDHAKYVKRTNVRVSPRTKNLIANLQAYRDFRYGDLLGEEGPLWFRGFAFWDDDEGNPYLKKLLELHDADAFVVGHTPQKNGIRQRFANQLFLIDTGLHVDYYKGGKPSALEFTQNTCTAIYLDERDAVCKKETSVFPGIANNPIGPATINIPAAAQDPKLDLPVGKRALTKKGGGMLPLQSDEEIIDFLQNAEILEAAEFGSGSTRPLRMVLEKDGVRMRAIFRHVSIDKNGPAPGSPELRRGFQDKAVHETAAYAISKLLGLNRVPPVVKRKYKGENGTLQLWIENAFNEIERRENDWTYPNVRFHDHQRRMMMIFDALIFNWDRNQGNILYGPDWYLWFIDHTRSFRPESFLPDKGRDILFCERNLWEKLKTITDAQLKEVISPYVSKRQARALLKRRELIVELINGLIEERGEKIVLFDLEPPE